MNQSVDIRYLITDSPYRDSPVKTLCPFHEDHDPSLKVYSDHTHCFVCGAHESASQFIARLGGDPEALSRRLPSIRRSDAKSTGTKQRTDKSLERVQTLCRVWHRTLMEGARQRRKQWFHARGIWDSTISRFKLGHTGDRFSVPLFMGSEIKSFQLRADPAYCDPEEVRYLSEQGGTESLFYASGSLPLVITEGPLDAILIAQYGFATLTTIRGAAKLSDELSTWRFPSQVVVAVDRDSAGRQAESDLQLLIPEATVAVWDAKQGKDITEYLLQFPAIERGSVLKELFE